MRAIWKKKGKNMPNTKNIAQIKDLQEKFSRAKSVVLTNYSGLTVADQTALRASLKAAGGEFVVAKNTLINRVLGKKELTGSLQGQTGVLFSYEDEISALKKLVEFIKTKEKPELKEGLLADKILTKADLIELSKLPGKNGLIVMLLSRLKGPAYGLVNVLTAGMKNLVYALEAVRKQKEARA
ncbi:MAG TPA: 50S ribosomal protein L10 [Candidatus Pacebacteria bacterium]|nr:MAG: 50S ribosomal protein L10 [Microgenomates group bacterium GW2011_GWB1_45_17]KKU24264.1 MAG: 50S ribosomal protein L10 [Microgenomates group bacterium GW2011_GWC1_46_15]KKU24980.1 MAG: 50S ribosomal protein L10 [Microgenomates group bacterium GW2011_GWA1_46_15]HAV15621.1 50S ribosomal protein L10 [Candidatus Paceibacterota bacterium]HCR93017.1 50S ribosomal protein L10 [Candidatus Paceibacterota bacterium]